MKQKLFKVHFPNAILFHLATMIFISMGAFAQTSSTLAITNGKETITKQALLKSLSRSLTREEIKQVEPFIDKSFTGISKKNKTQTQEGINDFKNSPIVARLSKWITCGDHCSSINDPTEYGFCYWKCILNGGPEGSAPKSAKTN